MVAGLLIHQSCHRLAGTGMQSCRIASGCDDNPPEQTRPLALVRQDTSPKRGPGIQLLLMSDTHTICEFAIAGQSHCWLALSAHEVVCSWARMVHTCDVLWPADPPDDRLIGKVWQQHSVQPISHLQTNPFPFLG